MLFVKNVKINRIDKRGMLPSPSGVLTRRSFPACCRKSWCPARWYLFRRPTPFRWMMSRNGGAMFPVQAGVTRKGRTARWPGGWTIRWCRCAGRTRQRRRADRHVQRRFSLRRFAYFRAACSASSMNALRQKRDTAESQSSIAAYRFREEEGIAAAFHGRLPIFQSRRLCRHSLTSCSIRDILYSRS